MSDDSARAQPISLETSAASNVYDVARLQQTPLTRVVEYHNTLSSTNDRARTAAVSDPKLDRLLVVVEEQLAGRGRGSNRWWTGRGSIACSLLFDPRRWEIPLRYQPMVALATAVAVVETVQPLVAESGGAERSAATARVGVHWPNDVYIGPRKLAGVLVEGLPDGRLIVGLGVNVNNRLDQAPEELRAIVTTLAERTGGVHDRTALLIEILDRLAALLSQLGANHADVGRRSDRHCLQHGQQLTVEQAATRFTGICRGIADDGALRLETAAGVESFYSGVLIKS